MKSSELAYKVKLPHTKVKRWTREFLPPDPRAKLQSGYTREYSIDEAFDIFIGGHLVSELKFEMQDAKKILSGIKPFMLHFGLYPRHSELYPEMTLHKDVQSWEIHIFKNSNLGQFEFVCLGEISDEMVEPGVWLKKYRKIDWKSLDSVSESLGGGKSFDQFLPVENDYLEIRVLRISNLRRRFLEGLKA